jgi:signal transduction histidine kinase
MGRAQPSSFRRRLTLLSLVTSASTLLLAATLFTVHEWRSYRADMRQRLATQAGIIGFTVTPALVFRDERAAGEALAALRAESQVTAATIFAPDGRVFATYGTAGAEHLQDLRLALRPAGEHMDFRAGHFELTRRIGDAQRPLGTLYLRADLTALTERVEDYAAITGAVLAVSLLTALGISWLLQREISTPVLGLVQTARRVAVEKDFAIRATGRVSDELGVLQVAFNDMLDEIERRDDQLRTANRDLRQRTEELARKNEDVEAFVYIVSHDLRAPLVNLQGFSRELGLGCDALGKLLAGASLPQATLDQVRELTEVEIPSALRFISASTAKFERLINALLELSRSGRRELRPERLDVGALVSSTLDSLRLTIEESGAEVVMGALPPAHGDATALGQVFANLITNAVRYLQPGRPGRIELGGEREDGAVCYYVRDNGVGIPESARKRLFQVFQRFRPDLADGEGMGLATVRRIVERHGGRVWAESTEGLGTTFRFTLPSGDLATGGSRDAGTVG